MDGDDLAALPLLLNKPDGMVGSSGRGGAKKQGFIIGNVCCIESSLMLDFWTPSHPRIWVRIYCCCYLFNMFECNL